MATLRDLRRKLQSVTSIQKITQAMELVAASRLRKAQGVLQAALPYAHKLEEMAGRLIAASQDLTHPLLEKRGLFTFSDRISVRREASDGAAGDEGIASAIAEEADVPDERLAADLKLTEKVNKPEKRDGKKIGLVVIAGDRGLCGSYNLSVFSAAEHFLQNHETGPTRLIPIGRKSVEYFKNKSWKMPFNIPGWGGTITYVEIEALTKACLDLYLKRHIDQLWIVYTHFINVASREIRIEQLLPIQIECIQPIQGETIFEPSPEAILTKILPLYCTMKMQSALYDAYTSELAARIFSMRAATSNAKELIETLTLTRNKVRQATVTKELIEITSGAQALEKGS